MVKPGKMKPIFVLLFLCAFCFGQDVPTFTSTGQDPSAVKYREAEEITSQLKATVCPTRAGYGLRDYWDCLWKSSMATESLELEANDILDDPGQIREKERVWKERRDSYSYKRPTLKSRRVRRQATFSETTNRVLEIALDLDNVLTADKIVLIRKCQVSSIYPGSSFFKFFTCLRDSSTDRRAAKGEKRSYIEYEVPWDPREFDNRNYLCVGEIGSTNSPTPSSCEDEDKLQLQFKFDPLLLMEEDVASNFHGADSYLLSQMSPFLYKYNNLISSQRQPGWSYNGLEAANQWHKLNVRKFYIPLKESVNLENALLLPEFAQTYPGTGDIVEALNSGVDEAKDIGTLSAPLDYSWTKDKGYHAYTRFLIPLLDEDDIEYFKYKEVVPETFHIEKDRDVVQDILKKLKAFRDKTQQPLIPPTASGDFLFKDPDPNFSDENSIPFVNVYRGFFNHYFGADAGSYRTQKAKLLSLKTGSNVDVKDVKLHNEFEFARKLMNYYLEATIAQLECLVLIVKDSNTIIDDKENKKIPEYLKTQIANSGNCSVLPKDQAMGMLNGTSNAEAVAKITEKYYVSEETLLTVYKSYYKRKDDRKRYTLPLFPHKYPLCKHNEPSPIDIVTAGRARKSSLQSYSFSGSAYELHRFFIMFPNDGSHLLSIGILNGNRLDDSSVRLYGGAVRGQNLTFQYMYLRFGKDWQSEGSEHRINGKAGQMELQMVFTMSGSGDALKYWHVLARVQNQLFQAREKLVIILSVLVDVVETDELLQSTIDKEGTGQDPWLFEPFSHAAYYFRKHVEIYSDDDHPRGYVSQDPVLRLVEFLPNTTGKFYTYRGSLSWPPCFGYVVWSVFEKRLYMSKRQFDEFAKMPGFGTSDHNRISDNFRRPKDIFVEEESQTDDYSARQEMIRKRTVNRHILEGEHDPHPGEEDSIAFEDLYYLTDDSGVAPTKVFGASTNFLLSFTLFFNFNTWKWAHHSY